MKLLSTVFALTWAGLWFTPDQQGQRLFNRGEFLAAAKTFEDPMWQGTALYRAGEFQKAAQAFARQYTAEGLYNQGTAWLMNGKYDAAVKSFDRALAKRPGWTEAIENRALAAARARQVEQNGGDMGDQKQGADKIVFDKDAKSKGQETQVAAEQAATNQDIQAMWLRRVQTRPADFLKAKFEYQRVVEKEETQ